MSIAREYKRRVVDSNDIGERQSNRPALFFCIAKMLSVLVLCSVLSAAMASNYYGLAPAYTFPWGGSGYGYGGFVPHYAYGYSPEFYGYANGFRGYGKGYGGYGKELGDYGHGYGVYDAGHSDGNYATSEHAYGDQGFIHKAGGHDKASASGHQASGYESDAKAAEGAHGSKKFGYFTQGSGPQGYYSKAVFGSDGFTHEASKGGMKAGASADGFKKGYQSVTDNEAYGKAGFDKGASAAGGYADGHGINGYGQTAGGYSRGNAFAGHAAGEDAVVNAHQGVPHAGIPFKA